MNSLVRDDAVDVRRTTRCVYSDLASSYTEETLDYDRYPGLKAEVEAYTARLPQGLILDIGCGSGRDSAHFSAMGRTVVAADLSLPMVTNVAKRVSCHAVCCDVVDLPFRSSSFAGVLASGVLLHLPRNLISTALSEVARVVARGGLVAISMKQGKFEGWRATEMVSVPRWFTYYEPDEFIDICQAIGLKIDTINLPSRKDWFTVIAGRD